MYQEYTPSERITRRCAKLWRRAIASQVSDAGDAKLNAGMSFFRAAANKPAPTNEQMDAFEADLSARLMRPHKSYPDQKDDNIYHITSIHTDYHPDYVLQCALETAGLGTGTLEIPVKSHTWMDQSSVSESFGYRAVNIYHYPLNDTLWMVTSLRGSAEEIEKLKVAVLEKRLPEIQVTDDEFNAVTI